MEWLSTKIDNMLDWLGAAFLSLLTGLLDFLKDIVVWVLDGILSALVALIELIPVPGFMSGGLTGLFSALPQSLVYLLVETGLVAGLAVVGAGVAFNLTRKIVTLGQW